jgi:hypothetical protein
LCICATSGQERWVQHDRITTSDGAPIKLHVVLPDAGLLGQVAEGAVLVLQFEDKGQEEDAVGAEPCEQLPEVVLLSDGARVDALQAPNSAWFASVREREVGLVVELVVESPTAWGRVLRLQDRAGQRLPPVPVALMGLCASGQGRG